MSSLMLLILIAGLGLVAWVSARARAAAFAGPAAGRSPGDVRPHSLPNYHGWYVALWAILPALLFFFVWQAVSPALVNDAVMSAPAAASLPADSMSRNAVLAEARGLATGQLAGAFNPLAEQLAPAYKSASSYYSTIGAVLTLLLGFAGGAFAYTRLRPNLRARNKVERLVMAALLIASLIAILATLGIVLSLLFESLRFFSRVTPIEFLFGSTWSRRRDPRRPGGSSGAFGAIPLFWGTVFIGAIIAMIVAIPLGLLSAIYLTQYASPRLRRWMKPLLEISPAYRRWSMAISPR
jgi:phosphate transport system permease protein